MPSKPKKPCAQFGCPNLTTERYCENHQDKVQQERRYYDQHIRDKQATSFYHSVEWKRAREQALMRDHGLCQHCLKEKRITQADMVHHIKEVQTHWEMRLVLSNLLSLCNSCHNKVHGH